MLPSLAEIVTGSVGSVKSRNGYFHLDDRRSVTLRPSTRLGSTLEDLSHTVTKCESQREMVKPDDREGGREVGGCSGGLGVGCGRTHLHNETVALFELGVWQERRGGWFA